MGNLARALLLGLALGCFAHSASATPPDIVDVRDELFGISRSSLFLLRTTCDNLGLHTSEHRDVVLVAIERSTGKESLWPVYRARNVPDEGARGDAQKTVVRMPANAVDPYAKLREAEGYPVGPGDGFDAARMSVKIEGGILTMSDADGEIARREVASILADVTASLDRLADAIGDYERLAPIRTRDLIGGQTFQAEQCKASDPFAYDDRSGAPPVRIVRLTCQEEEGQTTSLLMPIPAKGAPDRAGGARP